MPSFFMSLTFLNDIPPNFASILCVPVVSVHVLKSALGLVSGFGIALGLFSGLGIGATAWRESPFAARVGSRTGFILR